MIEEFHINSKIAWVDTYEEVLRCIDEGKTQAGVVSRFFSVLQSHEHSCVETSIIFAPVDLKMVFKKGAKINSILVSAIDAHLRKMKSDQIRNPSIGDRWPIIWKHLSRFPNG